MSEELKTPPPEDRDEVEKIVDRFLHELGEFGAESARIFVTYPSKRPDTTIELTKGTGNPAAQRGQVTSWIIRENEKVRADVWAELDDADGEDDTEN